MSCSNDAWTVLALLTAIFTVTPLSHSPASAGPAQERIAFILTGSHCREILQTLETALRQTDGVLAMDGSSVPGHLLIDIVEGRISPHDLNTIVHTATAATLSCQADIMQSCITVPNLTSSDPPAK